MNKWISGAAVLALATLGGVAFAKTEVVAIYYSHWHPYPVSEKVIFGDASLRALRSVFRPDEQKKEKD